MDRQAQPRDGTRRRVLLGLGAVGAAALGVGGLRSSPGDRPAGGTAHSAEPAVTAPPPRSRPESTTTPHEPTTTVSEGPPPPPGPLSVVVACRAAWGAEPASGAMVEHVPVRLTLHHTAVGQTASSQGPQRARRHQRYHQSLGWPDLAYHFLVDRTGLAYEGRDTRFRGDTGTEYDPTGHFLVCMEGDFDVQEPTVAQLETTAALFAWASQRFGIDASTLRGHSTYADTSCPGSVVTAILPDLSASVSGIGPVEIDLVCGSDGAELVSALETG